jgi:hypothetical protein
MMALKGKAAPPLYLDVRRLLYQHHAEFAPNPPLVETQTVPAVALDVRRLKNHLSSPLPNVKNHHQPPPRRKAING